MIRAPGSPDPPASRLLRAVGGVAAKGGLETLVLGVGSLGVEAIPQAAESVDRVLMVSALGAHPDARVPRLQRLWALEEAARSSARPVLTLRLAALVGPTSPLWLKLRTGSLPPRPDRLLQPVVEDDVIETLALALGGRVPWEGWYEVVGPEVLTLEELAAVARSSGQAGGADLGAWEPPLEELGAQGLAEGGPWSRHFGLVPQAVTERAGEWR